MKYKCPACKQILIRDARKIPIKGKKSFISYCETKDKYVTVKKVK